MAREPQHDRRAKGGADVWDEGAAGALLTADYFEAASGAYSLAADSGSYTLTGTPATLTYTPAGATYTLAADGGTYMLTGTAAGVAYGRRLVADPGAYGFTGTAAGIAVHRRLTADAGAYALSGSDAALTYTGAPTGYVLVAQPGSYTLSGSDAALVFSGAPAAAPVGGSFEAARRQYEAREASRKALNTLVEAQDATPAPIKRESAQDAPQTARTPTPAPMAPLPVGALPALADAAAWLPHADRHAAQAAQLAALAEAERQAMLAAEMEDVVALMTMLEAL